ncbi:CENP-B N-terminal DNA-binding domain [Popillia japonica]|uniref:CENP-B N-terminal DNA-binding domain n=1 Tax=Popillia japonica TaxID=7064 RepID=A0AAW1N2H6_POPJA
MVRKYERTSGARKYGDYNEDNLLAVMDAVKSGMSKKVAANLYKVSRTTLVRRILGRNIGKTGHPTVLTAEEERLITETLGIVSHWGFPLTKPDIRDVVKKFLYPTPLNNLNRRDLLF